MELETSGTELAKMCDVFEVVYSNKKEALKAANAVKRKLPRGMFRVVVWNNLGWHWKLVFEVAGGVHCHLYYDPKLRVYHAMIGHSIPGACDMDYANLLHHDGYDTDPVRLVQRVLVKCLEYQQNKVKQLTNSLVSLAEFTVKG